MSRIRGLFDISGKVALITGAAGTLGAAFAEALASEGAKIFLIDRRGGELSKVASDLQVKGLECEWLEAVRRRTSTELSRNAKITYDA
ncbi:MAG: SDR family NAD(P)-dependent oxidoreductase [Thaumarchaeota archaeon]|nr:SDR family NAD(P)-dependent oxidoreductase [Nitrososphaerota archaeon]